MASIITATVASGLTQSADNSGVLQLASGTGNLVTVPAVTGTAMVSGNMPTFSYWSTGSQAINASVTAKITYTNSEWDTSGGMYSSSRFTPTIAGYYQVNAATCITATGNSYTIISKNGSDFKRGLQPQASVNFVTYPAHALVYCNGSTDYIEIYFSNNGGTNQSTIGGSSLTYFQAILVRAE